MAGIFEDAKRDAFIGYVPKEATNTLERYYEIYEEHRHRIFSLAFYMTDSEMAAEELLGHAFARAFAAAPEPSVDIIDRALMTELRELMPLGTLTLEVATQPEVSGVRRNVKRVLLERAVVQLPATERLIFLMHDVDAYEHARISRLLGISEAESQHALHMARLRLRELLAAHTA